MAGDDGKTDSRGGDSEQKPHKTLSEVAQAHKWEDFKNTMQSEPCAREGLLYGVGTGFGLGVLRFIRTGNALNAGNWAVLAFAGVAVAAKKLCHFQQSHQRAKTRTLLEMQSKVATRVKGFEPSSPDAGSSAQAEQQQQPQQQANSSHSK